MKAIASSNNKDYIYENYDKFKISAKDLTKYTAINLRKIIDGILNAQNTILNDKDVIIADNEYLMKLSTILTNDNKRYFYNTCLNN